MDIDEKEISFKITNTYSTLNKLTDKTKNVWIVCHGLGYLSRYFIRYFKILNSEENYIIAPQAHSKYYQGSDFKYVGASWITKENTEKEIQNVLRNLDAIFEAENIPDDMNLIVLGFSQGVSISMRWVVSRKIKCEKLIIFSGSIPKEIKKEDILFLKDHNCDIYCVVGSEDEFLTDVRKKDEANKLKELFDDNVSITIFNGKHELKKEVLLEIIKR